MAKVVCCRGVGFDCPGVVRAETEQELLAKVAEQAKTAHNVGVITDEILKKVKSVVREE